MLNRRKTVKRLVAAVLALPFISIFKTKAKSMQDTPDQLFFDLEKVHKDLEASGRTYNSFLNVPKLNAGLYELKAGTEDKQQPHDLDEVYYVISGKSRFRSGNEHTDVKEGSILYVKAKVAHRFYDIEEDLKIMVFFSEMK